MPLNLPPEKSENISTKSQIGNPDSVEGFFVIDFDENIIIEEGPSIIKTESVGHSLVLGHLTNGVLGTANGKDGSQIVLGSAGRTETIHAIVNPNKVFFENFRDSTFKDDSGTSATWDSTTNYRIEFDANEWVTSKSIALKDGNWVNRATIDWRGTTAANISPELTVDGGQNWESVTKGIPNSFTTSAGNDLRYRLKAGSDKSTIKRIKVDYSTVGSIQVSGFEPEVL